MRVHASSIDFDRRCLYVLCLCQRRRGLTKLGDWQLQFSDSTKK